MVPASFLHFMLPALWCPGLAWTIGLSCLSTLLFASLTYISIPYLYHTAFIAASDCKGCRKKVPHTDSVINNRSVFLHSSGRQKSKTQVLVRLVSFEGFSLVCRWPATSFLYPHGPPLCLCWSYSLLIKTPDTSRLELTCTTSYFLSWMFKGPIPHIVIL